MAPLANHLHNRQLCSTRSAPAFAAPGPAGGLFILGNGYIVTNFNSKKDSARPLGALGCAPGWDAWAVVFVAS
jgi:hypothetical protein